MIVVIKQSNYCIILRQVCGFLRMLRFLHQLNGPPRNIFESGIKHHSPNPLLHS